MVGGEGVVSISTAIGMAGEEGFSVSTMAVGMMSVELKRP